MSKHVPCKHCDGEGCYACSNGFGTDKGYWSPCPGPHHELIIGSEVDE